MYSDFFACINIRRYYSNILSGNRCLKNIHLILFSRHVGAIICVLRHHDILFININLQKYLRNMFGAYTICQMQFMHIFLGVKYDL